MKLVVLNIFFIKIERVNLSISIEAKETEKMSEINLVYTKNLDNICNNELKMNF